MTKKLTQEEVNYTATSSHPDEMCERCVYFEATKSCEIVRGTIAPEGWCKKFEEKEKEGKVKPVPFRKFIPFAKVDAVKREVWGIVTAEVPDKDDEVCDYAKSKPYYEAVIAEMQKATDGKNLFPLRYMHQLEAVGKGIGFEFRDDAKEIFMGFKVVDNDAWMKVEEGVLTGFSQGGSIVGEKIPDPVYKNCVRYVADPSECSLVDNPCLGIAHFAYVKMDGQVEMRKFKKTEEAVLVPLSRLDSLIESAVKKASSPAKNKTASEQEKTKRVLGEDLASDCFLLVGDAGKPDSWSWPVKFADVQKTKQHIFRAIARFPEFRAGGQVSKDRAWKKLVDLAKVNGIDVEAEKARLNVIQSWLRGRARASVNKHARVKGDPGHTLTFLDDNIGKLAKGLSDAGRLACFVQELGWMFYCVAAEEEWEKDTDSMLPGMLESDINSLLDTLVAMVAEESQEMREEIAARARP